MINEKSASKSKVKKEISNKNKKLEDFFHNTHKKRERDDNNVSVILKEKKHDDSKIESKLGKLNKTTQDTPKIKKSKNKNKDSTNSKSEKLDVKIIRNKDINKNRNSCSICRDGGDLLLCDGCPKSFHAFCLKIKESDIPQGDWFCNNCIPKIERRNKREMEKEERKKIRNEKRRLYRKMKKEGLKNQSIMQNNQNNIININVIMNGPNKTQGENVIDLTLEHNGKNTLNNLLSGNSNNLPLQNLLSMFNDKNVEEVKDNKKSKIFKYPIPDEELYKNPELHKLDQKYYHKPNGNPSLIQYHFPKILKIWDFINTFKLHINISFFTPYQLYNSLISTEENVLLSEIIISILFIFLEEIDNNFDFSAIIENDLILLKIAINKNSNKRIILYKSWIEILRIIITSQNFELMVSEEIKIINEKLIGMECHEFSSLSFNEKLAILEYLIDSAVSTDFIKEIIKDDIEKRNNINREKNQLVNELKSIESRKRELDRTEKFTEPKIKVDNLNNKLQSLTEDNKHLSRQELTKLRKSLEYEREQFLSIIKESEQIDINKEKINNRIDKLNNELISVPSTNKKKLGMDAFGNEYYFFNDLNDRIFIKMIYDDKVEWREFNCLNQINELLDRLCDKGLKEQSLISKITKCIKKLTFENDEIASEWINYKIKPIKKIDNEYDYLYNCYDELENRITEYLYQDNKEWESFENRQQWKAHIHYKKDLNEFKNSLILFNEKFKNPYLINEYKSKIIDDEEIKLPFIYNDEGNIDPYKIDPNRIIASKAKLWSRDFESINSERLFKDYVSNVNKMKEVYFALFVFEGVVNDLIARREVYKIFKKKDVILEDELSDKKSKETKVKDFEIEDYCYVDSEKKTDIICRTRRKIHREQNKKNEEWNETCYICNKHGSLICCESCKNVSHLSCAGLKKEPESFNCEECNYKLVYKRQTRSNKSNK